jgi:class 3 adenylate cyclase/tetratricopeptide (TPR) repeat protein
VGSPQVDSLLAPYLPRLTRVWSGEPSGSRARTLQGSLVSVDISGFTALSERLESKGRAGVEELVLRISSCFDALIAVADRHGGDVLKFRGDALLVFFDGDDHPARAAASASDMQWTIEAMGSTESSVGPIELRMSAGVHSGDCLFLLTDAPYRALFVAGPAATRVFQLEDLASAGEIMLSAETAAAVETGWLEAERDGAHLMRRLDPGTTSLPPAPEVGGFRLDEYMPPTLRAHLEVMSGEAEHRQATVAFVKLSETDELVGSGGPEALLEQLDTLASVVGRACAAYGLTWLDSDIDVDAVKLILTGGAPSSSGQDEEGMLRALREIVGADVGLTVRAGVNRGHVFTGDIGGATRRTYTVMGDVVNLAARVAARSRPGGIIATAEVLDRAKTIYATETEPLLVKGKEAAVTAHHLGAATGTRTEPELDTTPIVGRDRELEAMRVAVDAARMGELRVVEVVGEPGIGKSRLVRELRTFALGFTHLTAAAEQYASSTPFYVWRDLLRQLAGITPERSREEAGTQLSQWVGAVAPDLVPWLPLLAIPFDAEVPPTPEASSLDHAASLDQLYAAAETFLERVLMMPTLLVFEDMHWLDESSRHLLLRLNQKGASRRWLVCVTTRPGIESTPALEADRIELQPLPPNDCAALALSIAAELALSGDEVTALIDRSGGNPLFVRELLNAARHGERFETLPESIESLITIRIDTLEPADRLLLRFAAVVGPTFDLDFVAEVLAGEIPDVGDPRRWEPLSGFVSAVGEGTFAFRHDLVRATAYEGLSFGRRREIHSRVARALEGRAGERADESAAVLSLHFFEAGEYDRTWRYAVAAGDRARDTFANPVAAELYGRAVAAAANLPELPATEVARVHEALGDVCERFGAYERSIAAFEAARRLVGADSPLLDARLLGKQANVCELSGLYAKALELCDQALARLDAAPEGPERDAVRASIELDAGAVHYRETEDEEAIRDFEAAAKDAERAGDRATLAHAYYLLDAAYTDSGSTEGVRYLELARRIYEELGDVRGLGTVLSNLGIHAYYEGRWDDAIDLYRESREAKERSGDVIGAVIQVNNEGEVLSDQGRVEESTPLFEEVLRVSRASGWTFGEGLAPSNLGRAAARAGRFEEAHAHFDAGQAVFEALLAERYVVELKARRAECLVYEGRYREALEVATECREAASRSPVGGLEALIERSVGYALHQARRPDEARPHFEDSLRIARALNAKYEVALTLRAMAATRHPSEADLAGESDAILEQLHVASVRPVPLP